MQAATNHLAPRSTYQAWGGFRSPQADAYPVKSMWKGTTLVTNSDGNKECFAIGPDGFIWSFETGGEGQSAGRLVSTGLSGTQFGLGAASGGLLVVLATEGNRLSFVMEGYEPARRWSEPAELTFPGSSESMKVEKLITQTRGENLFLGFIVLQRLSDGSVVRRLWEAVWAGSRPVLAAAPVAIAAGHAFWLDKLNVEESAVD